MAYARSFSSHIYWINLILLTFFYPIVFSGYSVLASTFQPIRLFLLSDIANEPDDAQSFVRLLLYNHEFEIKGLVATTSYWLNDTTRPDQMVEIIDAYEQVLPNLKKHATGWHEPSRLRSLVTSGPPLYGMDGVGPDHNSDGSMLLVSAVDASSEPLYVPIWGGANVLAQALWYVNSTRLPKEVNSFVAKLRVYAISDQDNSGVWIRRHFPKLFYISSIHHFNRYAVAAWGGISGDHYIHFPCGVSDEFVSSDWVAKNIQNVGSLGSKYPDSEFLLEGDTPSLLYLIPNGLSDPEHPEWGSWGGRYGPVNWGDGHFADSVDAIVVPSQSDQGILKTYMGSHVTVWRWRESFQNDFKARMQWTVAAKFSDANHAPVAVINDSYSREVLQLEVQAAQQVVLDAEASYDPDGNNLSFKWWQYLEPSSNNNSPNRDVAALRFHNESVITTGGGIRTGCTSAKAVIAIPSDDVLRKPGRGAHPNADKHLHIILEVSDGDLTSYRRVVLNIRKNSRNVDAEYEDVITSQPARHNEL